MSDLPQIETVSLGMWSGDLVEKAATTGMTVVPKKKLRGLKDVRPQFVAMLHDVCISLNAAPFDPIISAMTEAGVSVEDIADHYIPAVARLLGNQWCEDEVGFATVTIGSARLQGLLRTLGPEWRADRLADSNAPALLIAVGSNVHHTLGAMVLTGQMRRRGLSVRLMLGAEPERLGPTLRRVRFDAVFISSSSGESVDSLTQMVSAIKASTGFAPPVVIGGTIVEAQRKAGVDIAARTGADFVTNDPNEALALCGLTGMRRATKAKGKGMKQASLQVQVR